MSSQRYADDPTIPDEEQLWRRIPSWHIVEDANLGHHRVSTAAFDDEEMSVELASECESPDAMLRGHEGFGLVAIPAGVVRHGCNQIVVRDPLPPDAPAHALVIGRKTRSVLKAIVRTARWVRRPSGHDERSLPDPEP